MAKLIEYYVYQSFAYELVFATMRRSACRFITVDAYAVAVPFYEKCGFMFLSEKDKHSPTRAMYFDLINFPD